MSVPSLYVIHFPSSDAVAAARAGVAAADGSYVMIRTERFELCGL